MAKDVSELTQVLRNSASGYLEYDPVIPRGLLAYEEDTGEIKLGDGVSKYSQLSYVTNGGGGDSSYVLKSGDTMSGPLTLPTDTSDPETEWSGSDEAATKEAIRAGFPTSAYLSDTFLPDVLAQSSTYADSVADAAQDNANNYTDAAIAALPETEIASALNNSNVANALASGVVSQITGMQILVPANTPDFWIKGFASAQITAAGAGNLLLQIAETTTGTAVPLENSSLGSNFLIGTWSAYPSFSPVEIRVASSATDRTYALMAGFFRDSASSLAVSVRNAPTNKSSIRAVVA